MEQAENPFLPDEDNGRTRHLVDVPQVFDTVDAQAVGLVDKDGLGFGLQKLHHKLLAAVARMPGHVHVLAARLKQQALQKSGLAPALPDADVGPAPLVVIAVGRNALAASGLPVGKDDPGQHPVRTGYLVHRAVKADHGIGLDDNFAHCSLL